MNLKSKILVYSDFELACANAPLTSMVKILSDPINNQTIGSSAQVNGSLVHNISQ